MYVIEANVWTTMPIQLCSLYLCSLTSWDILNNATQKLRGLDSLYTLLVILVTKQLATYRIEGNFGDMNDHVFTSFHSKFL